MPSYHKVGFVTFAQNTSQVDYLKLAYLQAMNIKQTQEFALTPCAVIVDSETNKLITDNHRRAFEYVIVLDTDHNSKDSDWKLANECQVYDLSPFDTTIKVESDIWFTRNIIPWLSLIDKQDIVLSTSCKTYQGHTSVSRHYRKFFDDNNLPDVYNGLMMFKKSDQAKEYFDLAKTIRSNWATVSQQFKHCSETVPSTDVLYAVTALIYGPDRCTLPTADFFNFVHMKPYVQDYTPGVAWHEMLMNNMDGDMLRINHLNQYYPVHYFEKDFVTDNLIEYYEQRVGIN